MDTNELAVDSNKTNTPESPLVSEDCLDKKSIPCDAEDVSLFKEKLGQYDNGFKFAQTKKFSEILNKNLGDDSEKSNSISKPEDLHREVLEKYASGKVRSNANYMDLSDSSDSLTKPLKPLCKDNKIQWDLGKEALSEILNKNLRKSLFDPVEPIELAEKDLQFNALGKATIDRVQHNVDQMSKVISSETLNSFPIPNQATDFTTPVQIKSFVDKDIQVSHSVFVSQQIKEQIIDRILVSTGDLNEGKLVKVVLNPTLLEATEVNFQQNGKVLNVSFFSQNLQSLNFLQSNQLDLQAYLHDNLKQFKDVSVSVESEDDVRNFTDGRSRNRQEYQNLDDDEQ